MTCMISVNTDMLFPPHAAVLPTNLEYQQFFSFQVCSHAYLLEVLSTLGFLATEQR